MAEQTTTGAQAPKKRSLLSLITDVPTLVQELIQREIDLVKTEMITKLKALGIGVGLLVAAAIVVLFAVGVLLTAAVLALSIVLPGWLSALIIAVFLLLVAALIAFIGYRRLQPGIPPVPNEAIDSLKRDLQAIRGIGKRAVI